MFTVEDRDDALETLELCDTSTGSRLVLAPARGGIATRLVLAGKETFYLDESTLRDPTKNVRGGNPVLFPQPGKLEGDQYEHGGVSYALKQHGFARNEPWQVTRRSTTERAEATLTLVSNERTRAMYPWDFRADYIYSVRGDTFGVDLRIENTSRPGGGGDAMPFGAGFHPYFAIAQADKGAVVLGTKATHAFDNVTKARVAVDLDLTRDEVDLHLEDHMARRHVEAHRLTADEPVGRLDGAREGLRMRRAVDRPWQRASHRSSPPHARARYVHPALVHHRAHLK